eukprot:9259443-Pyramimonas_sp.AAC.1
MHASAHSGGPRGVLLVHSGLPWALPGQRGSSWDSLGPAGEPRGEQFGAEIRSNTGVLLTP